LQSIREAVLRQIILINVSGADKPGLTSSIADILSREQIQILDIGQAVIHDTLSLGILVEVPPGAESSPVLKDVLFRTHELGMHARFTPIDESSYMAWVAGQGKPRHIITLLARKLSAKHLARITSIISRYNMNIDRIERLSGRVPLGELPQNSKACIEISARGPLQNPGQMRRELLEIAVQMDVDIAYQEDNVFRRNRRLFAFDMDSTLIAAEVIDELAVAAGVGPEVAAITERAMRGEIDFAESFTARVALLEGLDATVLGQVADGLQLSEGAERLVSTVRKLGYKTAILSGGFTYFGQYLQRRLGIDYVFANELEIVDGKVTGKVTGQIVDGERKAQLLRQLASRENISLDQVIAVGDGANDLPMLSIAGLGIAFRAKPIVKESARHSISTLGLDGILYLLGYSDRETSEQLVGENQWQG
jgi:phosphoserine phosphatase